MLTTARATERAKEVSIRKIAGSERHTLVRQFLIESSLLALFSMALALFISELSLPVFNRYMDLDLRLSQLLNSSGIILVIGLIFIIGLVSGLYPALHFSSVDPLILINAKPNNSGHKRFRLVLVLFQLFIGIGVITLTGIVVGQYRYLIRKDLGFDHENLLVIRRPDGLKEKLEDYKKLIRNNSGVESVTNSTSIPGSAFSRHPYYLEGTSAARNYAAANVLVSFDFDSVYRLTLKEGRFFDRAIHSDSLACVINETMAKQLGGGNLVGQKLLQPTDKPGKRFAFTIIGVVKNFNFETLERPVFPMVMLLMPGNFEGYLTVRLNGNPDNTIPFLRTSWEKYTSAYPFVSYYLDESLREQYQPVRETGKIFTLLSVVTMLIACLGLFGLASYTFSRKGAEIGIRKALGAAPENIILQEVSRIVTFLITSSLLSWIGVYFLARSWLSDYANRISLHPAYFVAPFGIILLVTLLSVLYRSWLAANANPGSALRYE
jgi:putative ABC transport system permease protein